MPKRPEQPEHVKRLPLSGISLAQPKNKGGRPRLNMTEEERKAHRKLQLQKAHKRFYENHAEVYKAYYRKAYQNERTKMNKKQKQKEYYERNAAKLKEYARNYKKMTKNADTKNQSKDNFISYHPFIQFKRLNKLALSLVIL